MELPPDVKTRLFDAGADAVRFNAPLGRTRAIELTDLLSRFSPPLVIDLCCGSGELAGLVAQQLPLSTVVGIDTDQRLIDAAGLLANEVGLAGRLRFEVADVATWSAKADAAICVGGSHAFGGTEAMLDKLTELVPSGPVIVGDGVWQAEPDAWCLDTFGSLPAGTTGYAAVAEGRGWQVLDISLSELEEWDEFEHGWTGGVRSVGTSQANSFADLRDRQYQRYRGILGFCWAILTH